MTAGSGNRLRSFVVLLLAIAVSLGIGYSAGGGPSPVRADDTPCDSDSCDTEEAPAGEDVGASDEEGGSGEPGLPSLDAPAGPAPVVTPGPVQPVPQPQPATPQPTPASPTPQPGPKPAPVAQPANPAPASPTPQPVAPQIPPKPVATPPKGVTAAPAGPPSYPDILIREFNGSWTGGTATFRWWVSHCGEGSIKYPGGHLDFVMDRSQGDNGYPVSRVVSDFPVKGGKAVLTCHGIAPDPAVVSKEITIRAAPVSTTQVTIQTKPKKGLKGKVKKPKTVKATVPVAPTEVSGSYQGWCGIRSDGTWGFSQAPISGGAPALYKPGVGLHCDVGRLTKAEWKAYICKYFHCQDPTRRKK